MTTYYSNSSTLTVSNKSYNSNNTNITVGKKFYYTNNNTMKLSSRIYSSEAYYHVDFKVLYAWGKKETIITEPKIDVTLLNKKYDNNSDVILPTQGA